MFKTKKRMLYFIVACFLLLQTLAISSESSTAISIVDAYSKTIDILRNKISFDSETIENYEGAYNWDLQPRSYTVIATIWKNNDMTSADFTESYTYDGHVDERRIQKRKVQIVKKDGLNMTTESYNDKPWKYVAITDKFPTDYTGTVDLVIRSGRFLNGYGPNQENLAEGMRQGSLSLRKEMENIDGNKTYVLEATNKYGKQIIWIDPEHGYNPRRMQLIIEADNTFINGTPLGASPEEAKPGERTNTPRASIKSMEIILDKIEIEKINDQFLPISANINITTQYSTGEIIKTKSTHKRTNINLDPDFDTAGAFELDVPDGTQVYYIGDLDFGGVEYEWFEGKPRTKIDEKFLDSLDKQIEEIKNTSENESEKFVETNIHLNEQINEDNIQAQDKILNRTGFSMVLFLIPVGLLVIAIAIWQINRRLKA